MPCPPRQYPPVHVPLCFLLLLWLTVPLHAEHLTGGELTYTTLGADRFEVRLHLYVDCNTDEYLELPIPGVTLPNGYAQYGTFELESLKVVASPAAACLSPVLENCVRLASLVWITEELPDYHHAYEKTFVVQECCWDDILNNVYGPNSIGITFLSKMAALPPGSINASPVFPGHANRFLCNTRDTLDFSGSDANGDSLHYSLIAPLRASAGCSQGITPPCEGPYAELDYEWGYTVENPCQAESFFLDPHTGQLHIDTDITGEFAMGILIREFRDGAQIGEIHRAVQLNVVPCPDTYPEALLDAPQLDGVYQYELCSYGTLAPVNISTEPQLIQEYAWALSNDTTSGARHPEFSFTEPGQYNGTLILNPDKGCPDTAFFEVYVAAGPPSADFLFSDLCVPGPLAFRPKAIDDIPFPAQWTFGDGETANTLYASHRYARAGTYTVRLRLGNTEACADSASRQVAYYPPPAPDSLRRYATGCAPLALVPAALFQPLGSSDYSLRWISSDGQARTAPTDTIRYPTPGQYDLDLRLETLAGCLLDTLLEDLITVQALPPTGFAVDPPRPTVYTPDVVLLPLRPTPADTYRWEVDGEMLDPVMEPGYSFPDTGVYQLRLDRRNEQGCTSRTDLDVRVAPDGRYFLPSAFTPNGDGRNDAFAGTGDTRYLEAFQLSVFDRSGNRVFHTQDPTEPWWGLRSPTGVYVWRLSYLLDAERVEATGSVALLR